MARLDKAFNAFKSDPTPANAWALQVAMVEHQQDVAKQEELNQKLSEYVATIEKESKPKKVSTPKFRSAKGGL